MRTLPKGNPVGSPLRRHVYVAALGALIGGLLLLTTCDWLDPGAPAPTPTPTLGAQPSPTASVSSPIVGGEGRVTGTPTPLEVRLCLAEDLRAVAGWEGEHGSMSGGVSFANRSPTSCSLRGRPGIHLVDVGGNLLPVANLPSVNTPSAGTVVLRPGARAFVFFVWGNWCGEAPGPYKVAVALPGEGGQLTIPALDPEGKPLSTTPRCDSPSVTSTVRVGQFEMVR